MFRCCSLLALLLISAPSALAQDRRPSLMVMPLAVEDSQAPRLWVAQAIQESLSTEAGRKQLAVVMAAPERLAPPIDLREALGIARDNRVDLVLLGLCALDDQAMRVSALLHDVATGKEIGRLQASGGIRDIIDIQNDLYRQLRGLVLDAPAVVDRIPDPAPLQPAVIDPDPILSHRPTYESSGAAYPATGYAYYPAYAPIYVYEPAYVYTPPFFSFYFGYYGNRYDRDRCEGSGHHGWRPYGYRESRRDAFNDGRRLADPDDRGPRFRDGVTTLKYQPVAPAPSHVDIVRSDPRGEATRSPRDNPAFRTAELPRPARSAPPGVRNEAVQPAPAAVRSPSVEREVARPARAAPPSAARDNSDSPRVSSPAPRPPGASRGGADSPRASVPASPPRASVPASPPRASAPPPPRASAPAPAPRAPVSSSPSRGGTASPARGDSSSRKR